MAGHRLRGTTKLVWIAIALLLGGGLAAVGNKPLRSAAPIVDVTVMGQPVRVAGRHVRVATALSVAGAKAIDGALLSVVTHKVLDPHHDPAEITMDGLPVTPKALLHPGARIEVVPGDDVTEDTTVVHEPVAPPRPPDVEKTLWYPGVAGDDEVVRGVRSGEEVSRRRTLDPVPPREEHASIVALTFDDGPAPQYTGPILQILKDEGIVATFCVVGHWADTRGEWVKAERDAGMTICDHTEHHVLHLDAKPHDQVEQEVLGGADAIRAQLGADPPIYRPPGGFLSPDIVGVAHGRGMRVLHWSVDPHDYETPPPQVIFDRVMAQVRPGAVILLHDGGGNRTNTVAMLRQLIDTLKARGYAFATPMGPPPPPPPPPEPPAPAPPATPPPA